MRITSRSVEGDNPFVLRAQIVRFYTDSMADAVAGVAGKAAMSMFGPHPSITIITFWQGILEVIARGISLVSC